MKMHEFKLRLICGVNDLIDDYFSANTVVDKFINSTLKIMVKQNAGKLDGIMELFMDENGCIDEQMVIEEYSKMLGENGILFDLRDFIKNDTIKNLLPNKALIIRDEDVKKMFQQMRLTTNTV
jgi:hypothetical protein